AVMNILQQTGVPRASVREGQVLRLGRSGRLGVLAGRVWLTQAGDRRDRVIEAGESVELASSRAALIEGWGGDAVVAWRPRSSSPCADVARGFVNRCWQLMHPLARLGLGSAAALTALLIGALVFGPLSEARSQSLANGVSLHNPQQLGPVLEVETTRHADRSRSALRARLAAQEARRRPSGAA
ncbi:MAG: DUF2917 domain-containing protein, partial [Pseudomonadota bacterium]|nr:DUF2917 domain-containing protein [Pseudomonadota bacterium]